MKNLNTTWGFVEQYFPNYSNHDEILRNNELSKAIEEGAENLENQMNDSNAYVYGKAIEGYLETFNEIENAKQVLKEAGYFVDNLWTVHDVKSKYECTDEQAQKNLNDVFSGEYLNGEINVAIDIAAEANNLLKRVSKYFKVSGFWKDTKVKFSDYIIKELDRESEEDDEDECLFQYGINEDELKELIESKWKSNYDFVITSYEETTLN